MTSAPFIKNTPLVDDYLNQKPEAYQLYGTALKPDWKELSDRIMESYPSAGIIEQLIEQNRPRIDSSVQGVLNNITKDKTLFVVTGQQMGLMVSPLYTLYKILTAIERARKLNGLDNGYYYVPVFWLEGEDHDFAEVNHLSVFGQDGSPLQLSLAETSGESGLSMNKRRFSTGILTLMDNLRDALKTSTTNDGIWAFLNDAYQPGADWLTTFAAHLGELFSEQGLLLFNAGTEGIKTASRPFFEKLISENNAIVKAFQQSTEQISQNGYSPQVHFQAGRSYIFLSHQNGPRIHLLKENKRFKAKTADVEYSAESLTLLAGEHPQWFSSTVLTRPLWQSWLLPTVSYIGGGAEVAYWAQTTRAFNLMGLTMPQVQLRRSVTLLEPRIQRLLKKYRIRVQDITGNKETFIAEFLKVLDFAGFNQVFSALYNQLNEASGTLSKQTSTLDPTLQGPVNKTFRGINGNLEKLHNRLMRSMDEKNTLARSHLELIYDAVFPDGYLQERRIGAIYFQARYGTNWISALKEQFAEADGQHIIFNL